MSYTEPPPGTAPTGASSSTADASLGTLFSNLSQQMSTLVRDEIRLAQAEVTQKGKQAGIGLGLFSVAGLLAFYGVATLVATAVLALALAIDAWLAALVVGVVLLAAAGVAGVMGKGKVRQVGSPKPEQAIAGLKEDVATLKGDRS